MLFCSFYLYLTRYLHRLEVNTNRTIERHFCRHNPDRSYGVPTSAPLVHPALRLLHIEEGDSTAWLQGQSLSPAGARNTKRLGYMFETSYSSCFKHQGIGRKPTTTTFCCSFTCTRFISGTHYETVQFPIISVSTLGFSRSINKKRSFSLPSFRNTG